MALAEEMATFRRELSQLLAAGQKGKFVLIQGNSVAGTWDTYGDSLTEGYNRFGLAPFLVKRIDEHEKVHFVRQPIQPCPTSPPDSPSSDQSSMS